MIDVDEIMKLHAATVAAWHLDPILNDQTGFLELVCQQHIFNFELWHQEDIARSPEASDAEIAQVKRRIDKFNQQRNDAIEKLDDAITEMLRQLQVTPKAGARQNTETPGSTIDRLSIMALRLYHYEEQIERSDVDVSHLDKVGARIQMCREQQRDLGNGLQELLSDIFAGEKRHKTYRQMKMYNDASLNPYLYKQKKAVGVE
ncbi:MAG: DUF4254 domain-containing protein [Pirellulaceae bacterium]|nr:DUF4254 domain-containing protein [Pirellulaceae bacterium]